MTKHLIQIIIMSTFLLVVFLSFAAKAQTNGVSAITTDGSNLVGSWHEPKEILAKVDAIFTGQFVTISEGDFVATGGPTYGAKVKVLQLLKGTVDPQINVLLHPFSGGQIHERKPELNHTYIFFVKVLKGDNLSQVVKLMDGTDDRIAKVKALIAPAPK
jgi:hypothetical protein